MPKLVSQKNLRKPAVSGYVLSSSTVGIQTWVDNKSVGISSDGTSIGTASTINFSGATVSISAGIASVAIAGGLNVYSIIGL
jgi:hypothetical protein